MRSCRRVGQNVEASLEWPKVSANSHPGQIHFLDRTEHVVLAGQKSVGQHKAAAWARKWVSRRSPAKECRVVAHRVSA